MDVLQGTIVLVLVAWMCSMFYIWGLLHGRGVRRAVYRVGYRRGRASGFQHADRTWTLRRQRELHNAGRTADVRHDAGPAARVSKARFTSRNG